MFEDSLVQYYLEHMEKDHRRQVQIKERFGELNFMQVSKAWKETIWHCILDEEQIDMNSEDQDKKL